MASTNNDVSDKTQIFQNKNYFKIVLYLLFVFYQLYNTYVYALSLVQCGKQNDSIIILVELGEENEF